MRVYLDTCVLSRLTDDRAQPRVRREVAAIRQVLRLISQHKLQWVSGTTLRIEARNNPDSELKQEAFRLLRYSIDLPESDEMLLRAEELRAFGYGAFDAAHLAAAEYHRVDVLLTTDDRLIRRAARGIGTPEVRVVNPVDWIAEVGNDSP